MQNNPLKSYAVSLHRQLLDQLLLICEDRNMEPEKRLHTAVITSEEFLDYLYELIPCRFDQIEDEILFFKSIKPLFASEKEYHQRLYHAKVWHCEQFYAQELQRMEKLLGANTDFSNYYHKGHTHHDVAWFTQGQAPFPTNLCLLPWETNPKHTSARDGWVSGLMAVERYKSWLEAKVL